MAASICKFCLVADATGRGITLLLLLLLRFLSHLLDLLLIHFKLLVQLFEHGLLLLLFFLLTIHDSQDDFPLLFREVAEVRHLGLRRRLRGRRGGSRAAPGPERSRHVWRSRTTLGKQGGNSAGSRGSGAGGWGSLRGWTNAYKSMAFNPRRQPPSPRKEGRGRGGPRGEG